MFRRKKKQLGQAAQIDVAQGWYSDAGMDSDYHTLKLPASQPAVHVGMSAIIGTRKTQQDTIYAYAQGGCALALVCDGMGGMAGGERASRVAADSIVDAWFAQGDGMISDIPAFFQAAAACADRNVYLQKDENGNPLRAGTTVAAVVVQNGGLYWLSVGDSRIYFIHGNEILTLNVEHNYRMVLNSRLKRGEITPAQYAAEEYRAEALISYIGSGNVSLMDINAKAYPLVDGDMVLLSSDGLFRSLNEEEILNIVKKKETDMQCAANALTAAVEGRKKQDNTSVVLLQYRE